LLVNYCDLCGQPLKENNFHSLYCSSPDINAPDPNKYEEMDKYYKDYARYLLQVQKEVKEICPTCKYVYDKIFEYRLQGLSKMTEECANLFNLPSKKNPKERGNGKEKK
jgi:hypothetical protein